MLKRKDYDYMGLEMMVYWKVKCPYIDICLLLTIKIPVCHYCGRYKAPICHSESHYIKLFTTICTYNDDWMHGFMI